MTEIATPYDITHRPGALTGGLLPDGREWLIYPMVFTYRVTVGDKDEPNFFDDYWCYHTFTDAMMAVAEWDGVGEPNGWHATPGRRRPDGTPQSERQDQ